MKIMKGMMILVFMIQTSMEQVLQAPVASGVIALYMQMNPGATSAQVKEWLKNRGTKLTDKYQDEYTDDTQTTYWTGAYNMRGAEKRLLHDETANDAVPSISNLDITGISIKQT